MVIRTYFDKNNTIIKDSEINTGKNPVAELYYGTDENGDHVYTRFLFHFDVTRIKEYFDGTKDVRHILKMTNTGSFRDDLLNTTTGDGKKRTSSFDLSVFKVEQNWDEGTGYDHQSSKEGVVSTGASNFNNATTSESWGTNPFDLVINEELTQSFDAGNENLEIDITPLVKELMADPESNHGLGIAFETPLENMEREGLNYVGFFTRHTQTFYQPYIESRTTTPIKDDRHSFFSGRDNKLYLFSNENGKPKSLGDLYAKVFSPITNETTRIEAIEERVGVYSVGISVPFSHGSVDNAFGDKWYEEDGDILIYEDFAMLLEGKENIGHHGSFGTDHRIDISGIKYNERIKRGDVRKIVVNPVIPYSVNNQNVFVDNIKYRIYVKEGEYEHTVIDFHDVDRIDNVNHFLLDTQSLLPNTYYLDIKTYSGMEIKSSPGVVKFEIVK